MNLNRKAVIFLLVLFVLALSFWHFSEPKNPSQKESQFEPESKAISSFQSTEKRAPAATSKSSGFDPHALSQLVEHQPSIKQISEKTALPAIDAAEVKFQINEILAAAQSNATISLRLTQSDSVRVELKKQKTENGYQHIFGYLDGKPIAEVSLTTDSKSILVGIIQAPPAAYQIVYSGHDTSYVVKIDQSKVFRFQEADPKSTQPPGGFKRNSADSASIFEKIIHDKIAYLKPFVSIAEAAQVIVSGVRALNVYFYFTNQFVSAAGGMSGAQATVANQIAIANNSLANSGARISFAIVGSEATAIYPDNFNGSGELNSILSSLTANRYVDANINFLRANQIDLVQVVRAYQAADGCGLAYLGDNTWNNPLLSTNGVSVVGAMCNFKYTIAHELGHNIGLDHDSQNAHTGRIANQYNYGYFDASAKTRTIMAYATYCGGADYYDPGNIYGGGYTTCPVLQQYSTGQPINGVIANNARKANEIADALFSNPIPIISSLNGITSAFSANTQSMSVTQGSTLYTALTHSTGTSLLQVGASLPSNYFQVFRQGTPIISQYFTSDNYVINSNDFPVISAPGTYEIRYGNRVQYQTTSINITNIDTPLSIGSISISPAGGSYAVNQALAFSIAPTGSPAPACSWAVGGVSNGVSGYSMNQAFSYSNPMTAVTVSVQCARSSAYGNENLSASIAFNIFNLPTIVTQPVSQNVGSATSASLSVVASGAQLNYQWYKNGTAMSGANLASLVLSGADFTGTYKVRVSNPAGYVESQDAVISNATMPTISGVPANLDVNEGQTLNLAATVSGNPTPTLQWLFNGAVVSTQSSYSVPNVARTLAGVYTLKATSSIGSATATVAVRVLYKPAISSQPIAAVTLAKGQPLNLNLTASGMPAPTYAWFRVSGSASAVQLSSSSNALSIASIDWIDSGTYYCVVTNQVGSVTSAQTLVTVPAAKNEMTVGQSSDVLMSPGGINLMGIVDLDRSGGFDETHP